MDSGITAEDLLPLIEKLPREEQLRLAKLALSVASKGDSAAYIAQPPTAGEVAADEDSLCWEGEDWEEFYAAR